ncbi:MAG: hypothetical protein KBC69_00245 [Candidatus Magasanikbacteria bacterium]|nr:hypothetical protein [Candidatus Magasanikbacteria bacterium]
MLKTTTLSSAAEKVIQSYLNLPFPEKTDVRCPYFNNAKRGQRGQLKALIGKGTPQEIVEEAKIIAIQYKQDILHTTSSPEDIRKFLIENNLGVDCSGFITNVLQAEFLTKNIDWIKHVFIVPKTNIIRWLISKLRPAEQISVSVLANEKNTETIADLSAIQAGDLIFMLKTGPKQARDHILLVTKTTNNTIYYTHARAWSSEGRYGHGVSIGTITIAEPHSVLLDGIWEEKNNKNENNETFLEAKQALILTVKRVKHN